MPNSLRPGDLLAARYRLDDLLSESGSGRFWRARDRVLHRHVALHVIAATDERAPLLLDAARRAVSVVDPRVLRVLDAERRDDVCYVVNEWGYGTSLDIALANNGPLPPRRAAWVVAEVADTLAATHRRGVAHGRLVPENVLIDETGQIRIIGLCVDAAMHGLPEGSLEGDLLDLGGLLHAALTGRWAGASGSAVPGVPHAQGRLLRPRQVRAGVPRSLDDLVDALVNPHASRTHRPGGAGEICEVLGDFVGEPSGIAASLAAANPRLAQDLVVLPQVPDIGLRAEPPDDDDASAAAGDSTTADDDPAAESAAEEPEPSEELLGHTAAPSRSGIDPGASAYDVAGARPLFAPSPPGGATTRTPRPGLDRPAGGDDEYWPNDTPTGEVRRVPHGPRELSGPEIPGGRIPGRRSLRVAAIVAVVAVIFVGVSLARYAGSPRRTDRVVTDSASPTADTVIQGVSAELFAAPDEQVPTGSDVALAVDDDPASAWRTGRRTDQLAPGGIGLLLDLGGAKPVAQVDLRLIGAPTGVSLYVLSERPQSLDGLRPAAVVRAAERETIALRPRITGRYVLIRITALPPVEGGFEAGVADVTLSG